MLYHCSAFFAILAAYWWPRYMVHHRGVDHLIWLPELLSQAVFLGVYFFTLCYVERPNELRQLLAAVGRDFFLGMAPVLALEVSMICYLIDGIRFCVRNPGGQKVQTKLIFANSIPVFFFLPVLMLIKLFHLGGAI